jgi:hypothetical protein
VAVISITHVVLSGRRYRVAFSITSQFIAEQGDNCLMQVAHCGLSLREEKIFAFFVRC